MNKKDLAYVAVKLFNSIDQAEQFDITSLFYHCDNKFLMETIERLADTVRDNIERDKRRAVFDRNVSMDDEELEEIFSVVEKLKGGI